MQVTCKAVYGLNLKQRDKVSLQFLRKTDLDCSHDAAFQLRLKAQHSAENTVAMVTSLDTQKVTGQRHHGH